MNDISPPHYVAEYEDEPTQEDEFTLPLDSGEPNAASPKNALGESEAPAAARSLRRKDPYRYILPRKMSLRTAGVLAAMLRPSSVRRMDGTVSPSGDGPGARTRPAPTKKGSSLRKARQSVLPAHLRDADAQSMELQPMLPPARSTDDSDVGFRHGQRGFGRAWQRKQKEGTVPPYAAQFSADGYTALHLAAQSNHLEWMGELLQSNPDVNVSSLNVGFTPLHLAARYGCLEAASLLLKHGASRDAATTHGQRPIHLAARRGHTNIVRILLDENRDQAKATDKDLMTPLHMAAIHGSVDVCRLLIDYGAEIHARDVSDITPLMLAASAGHPYIVRCILQSAPMQGLRTSELLADRDNEGRSVLHIAVNNGSIKLTRLLLEEGADVNAQKGTGQTPLHQAAVIGNTDMAKLLLEFRAAVDKGDDELMTPLHRAAMYNRPTVVELLLDNGADINARDKDDFTPLLCACWKGHTEVARLLISRGADIRVQDNELRTCVHWSVEMGHADLVKALLEEGGLGVLDWQDRWDQTALHYAAEIGNVALLNLLISKGARGDPRDIDEKTPLHTAAQCGRLPCVKVLLQLFPSLLNDDDVDGMTPLLLASHGGHVNVVRFLLRTGADIATRNDEKKSALSLAVGKNHVQTASILIDNNADINAMDKEKNTPLHLACEAGHYPVAKLLLAAGAEMTHKNAAGLYPLDVAIARQDSAIAKAIVTSKHWESAMSNRDEEGLTPMKKLIEEMPEAALLVLDHCVKKSHADPRHPDLEITHDYSYIDPGPDDTKERFFGVQSMAQHNREELLSHEISQNILSRKWSKFAGTLYTMDLILYCLLIACLMYSTNTSHLITSETPLDSLGCIKFSANDTSVVFNDEGEVRVSDGLIVVSKYFIIVYCICTLALHSMHMLQMKVSFFLRISNYTIVLLCVSCIMYAFPSASPPCALQWKAGAIANFLAWINFILYFQPIKYIGIYIGMFLTTLKSLLQAMFVYIFFMFAFGLAFYICWSRLVPFRSAPESFLTTFVMTLGEIGKADIFETTSLDPFGDVSYVLFVSFLFMMPLVLVNLTIGISVGDIEGIYNCAYLQRLQILTELIWEYETRLPKIVQRRMHEPKVTVTPNRPPTDTWGKLKRLLYGRAYGSFVPRDDRLRGKESSVQDVVKELSHARRTICMLDVILQRHTDTLKRISDKLDIDNELADLTAYKELMSDVIYPDM